MNKVGVRDLVEFLMRSGDLNNDMKSLNTAQAGAAIHRSLQKSRSDDYQKEYYLDKTIHVNGQDFLIHGRADGVVKKKTTAIIEEIKTSDTEFEELPENKLKLYWGQVKVYAYLVMNKNPEIKSVTMKLTYVQTPDAVISQDTQKITAEEANQFFHDLTAEFAEWLRLRSELDSEKVTTAKQLEFPFGSYRAGQRELASSVYKSVLLNKHLFAEAPTGTGKTISTLFPAVKAMGDEQIKRVFYMTAKQSTRRVAEDAIDLMSSKGLRLRSITLTAKAKIKFPEEEDVPDDQNPYLIGYYDRLKPALKDILRNNHQIDRTIIENYGRKYQLDPFELSLDVSSFCDVIIGDYNHLFDPQVHLVRFFDVEDTDNFFLIDEAHNLVSRSRDMYSASLSSEPIDDVMKIMTKAKAKNQKILTRLRKLKKEYKAVAAPLEQQHVYETSTDDSLTEFNKAVTNLTKELRKWIAKADDGEDANTVLDYFFACVSYLKINEYYGPNYKMRILLNGDNITVREFCMDPSRYVADSLDMGGGAVLFSATLSPMDYYQQVLGDESDSLKYQLSSPFPPENQDVIVTSYIDTTYHHREQSIDKIVSSTYDLVSGKKGNYLIFAPSNTYLDKIYDAFKKAHPDVETIRQESGMDEHARNDFMAAFDHPNAKPIVGFALLGGIFSEGIDLIGDKLIGVGIVGVGLPGLNPETNLIRDYFDQLNGHGFEYAYQLPGLNNVFQAAGRLIRSQHDHGIVLLMDQRFTQTRYTSLFPSQWKNYQIAHNEQELRKEIKHFWQKPKEE